MQTTATHEEQQYQAHEAECEQCRVRDAKGYARRCKTGGELMGRVQRINDRRRDIDRLAKLESRKASGQYLDRRDYRDLISLQRRYAGASRTDSRCRHWTADQGCPLHGEMCSPERDPALVAEIIG